MSTQGTLVSLAYIPNGQLVVVNSVSSRGLKIYEVIGVTKSDGRFLYRLGKADHRHRFGAKRNAGKDSPESQLVLVHPKDPGVLDDSI